MNILSTDHKPLCSEDAQARPRILSTRTQCLDSQPHSCCITLSPPLTYGELLTGVPKSMVTWPGPGQSVCSILPGNRDWLETEEVTNQGPGPGLMQESRGRGFLVLPEGLGLGNVRLQQWEGREVGPGRFGGLPTPVRPEPPPVDEGAAERQVLLGSRSSTWDLREVVCLWLLFCLSVSLFEPRWVFCPAG